MVQAGTSTAVSEASTRHARSLGFTDFQWYFSNARNTVYWAAFTDNATPERFRALVARLIELAPQLGWRQDDRNHTHVDMKPFPVERIIAWHEVSTLDGLPDAALQHSEDLFDDPTLPCFRASCWSLPPGTRTDGNSAMILFRFSHALMEGVDAALLLRARDSVHELPPTEPGKRIPQRILSHILAALLMPGHFVSAALHRSKPSDFKMKTLVLDRHDLRRVANDLGVQQRTLLFALVMYGVYGVAMGAKPRLKPQIAAYSRLSSRRVAGDDDFMRMRMHLTMIRNKPTFAAYVQALEKTLAGVKPESLGFQMHYNAVLSLHRRLSRIIPFAYGRRFFHYLPYEFVLSLVPPQKNAGEFSDFHFNDIYCGSHTPGVNCCVFTPQQDRFSLNIYGNTAVMARFDKIGALAAELGIRQKPRGSAQKTGSGADREPEAAIARSGAR